MSRSPNGQQYLQGVEEHEATPVKIVGREIPLWQNIAILIGTAASLATLYNVLYRSRR